jgi:hypothetical protein
LLYIFKSIAPSSLTPCNINIAKKVLPLIETDNNPSSTNNSILSNNTYIEEETPEPNNPEAQLA